MQPQTHISRFISATNPAKRIVAEKRRNSQHSAVFRPQAGNGAVLGISELERVPTFDPAACGDYSSILGLV